MYTHSFHSSRSVYALYVFPFCVGGAIKSFSFWSFSPTIKPVPFLQKHSVSVLFQSLKNDDSVAKKDVQRILELSHKQR